MQIEYLDQLRQLLYQNNIELFFQLIESQGYNELEVFQQIWDKYNRNDVCVFVKYWIKINKVEHGYLLNFHNDILKTLDKSLIMLIKRLKRECYD